jgi:hypothetical protein
MRNVLPSSEFGSRALPRGSPPLPPSPSSGLIFGAGANHAQEQNLEVDVTGTLNDERSHLQVFGAAQYFIWDQFLIKAVVAYANAHWNPLGDPPPIAEFRHEMTSGRLRLMYRY